MFEIPTPSLVVLIGPSGSGKSTFARRHFLPTEVLSSDYFRGVVSDDTNSQAATKDAFDVLYYVLKKRLDAGRLTVIDATNVKAEDRKPLLEVARAHHLFAVAIAFDLGAEICIERNKARADREGSQRWVVSQHGLMRRSLGGRSGRGLEREGFRYVRVLSTPEEVESLELVRRPLWTNRQDERGPFDVIGDVHGCLNELVGLLEQLGYQSGDGVFRHPDGRRAVFVGDLVDRGPSSLGVLRLVREMLDAKSALCVPGNHDVKLVKALLGRKVKIGHGLERTLAEFEALEPTERDDAKSKAISLIDGLVSHMVLDGGKLVVAHAGMKQAMQGRSSAAVREFALYGETTGEIDDYGLPVRSDWAASYRGDAAVVYGHTPVVEAEWINGTICIDTGCVFGGKLTALRYPELELVSVPAAQVYFEPIRPLAPARERARTLQQEIDDVLDLGELDGKRIITTRLVPSVTVSAGESAAALEAMSRFAVSPRWLIYLPPTMSPPETSKRADRLEHPEDAFAYFRRAGVRHVIAEEKHMGSRAIAVLSRDAESARRRFGVEDGSTGVIYTRTGRRFFDDAALEGALLDRLRKALDARGFWDRFESDWFCFDAELMPWSAKARALLQQQYAAVGHAAGAALADTERVVSEAAGSGLDVSALLARTRDRRAAASAFTDAYRRYVWRVEGLSDFRLAPFHLLAAEGKVFVDREHAWHMSTLGELAQADREVIIETEHHAVNLDDPASEAAATAWWEALTARGGEGFVVKPHEFVTRGMHGVVQPAIKCRGPEYLRIIYGPEYLLPGQLDRLRARAVRGKRALAIRELALGVEALERFVKKEPLRRVHECVFAVLALESQPVDPRL